MSTQPNQLSADDQQVKDFAGKIRAKYPGAYDDMPDFQLSKAIATKHPEYADMLPKSFSAPAPAGSEQERLGISAPNAAPMKAQTETQFEKDRTPDANSGTLQHIGGLLKSVGQGVVTQGLRNMSPIGMAESGLDTLKAIRGVPAQYEHERARGINPISSALSAVAPVAGVPVRPQAMEEAANRGDVGGVTGEMVGGMGLAATPLLVEGANSLRGLAADKLFPGGEANAGLQNLLEKPIKTVGEWGLRKATGAPAPLRTLAGEPITMGDVAEGREAMNTDIAKERQTRAGAHSQMEKELAARGQVQTAAHNQMETDLAAREAAKLKGNPTPFGQGMTSTSAPGGANLELPTVPEGPAPEPAAKIVAKGEKPQKSLIVNPSEGVPAAKTTLQSYPREVLARMASKGDLRAAQELQRNPGNVDVGAIPNLRYIGIRPLIQ